MKKIITVWRRYNRQKDGSYKWELNHISDGFDSEINEPIPQSDMQKKSWKGGRWRKFKAYLVNGMVELDKEG